jgi:hypothetical protein
MKSLSRPDPTQTCLLLAKRLCHGRTDPTHQDIAHSSLGRYERRKLGELARKRHWTSRTACLSLSILHLLPPGMNNGASMHTSNCGCYCSVPQVEAIRPLMSSAIWPGGAVPTSGPLCISFIGHWHWGCPCVHQRPSFDGKQSQTRRRTQETVGTSPRHRSPTTPRQRPSQSKSPT